MVPDKGREIVLYERYDDIGGIWSNPNTPVYEDIRTNLPKELMMYPDFRFSKDVKASRVAAAIFRKRIRRKVRRHL